MICEIVAANKNDADNQGQLDGINVYFKETLVDSESGSLDVIEASPICTMVKPHNFIFGAPGAPGAGNNCTKAHHTEDAQLIDAVFDMTKKGGESGGDCQQQFKIKHSLGEYIGSGLATLLLMKITHNYLDRIRMAFSVYHRSIFRILNSVKNRTMNQR